MTLWNKPEARRVPEQNVAQQGRQPTRRHQRAGMGEPKGRMTQTPGADRQAAVPKLRCLSGEKAMERYRISGCPRTGLTAGAGMVRAWPHWA